MLYKNRPVSWNLAELVQTEADKQYFTVIEIQFDKTRDDFIQIFRARVNPHSITNTILLAHISKTFRACSYLMPHLSLWCQNRYFASDNWWKAAASRHPCLGCGYIKFKPSLWCTQCTRKAEFIKSLAFGMIQNQLQNSTFKALKGLAPKYI